MAIENEPVERRVHSGEQLAATQRTARNISAMTPAVWLIAIGAVIGGLYFFRDTLTPFALAIVLWLTIDGLGRFIETKLPFVSRLVATVIALCFILALVAVAAVVLAQNLQAMALNADVYVQRMNQIVLQLHNALGVGGPVPSLDNLIQRLNPSTLVGEIGETLQSVASNLVFILIYVGFLFAAASGMTAKLDVIFPEEHDRQNARDVITAIRTSVDQYLWVQTALSIITTCLTYCCLILVGLENAVFWSFLIFFLNYIPTIGSIIAVALPTAFALVQFPGFVEPLLVAFGIGFWQFVIGNFVQPRLTGDSLNLSAVVVLFTLALWGSIWGIAGAFLAAPLTVILMIICAQAKETYWISVLLSANARPVIVARGKEISNRE